MTPYHIAKLVSWAGTLKTRKRLQKSVYLLQSAGCDAMDASFILHHYGPYSTEVATLADQMSANGLLEEATEPNTTGFSYSYTLTDKARESITKLEADATGQRLLAALSPFAARARQLNDAELSVLEHASTIAFFYRQERDWDRALSDACDFKKLAKESPAAREALAFARCFVPDSRHGVA